MNYLTIARSLAIVVCLFYIATINAQLCVPPPLSGDDCNSAPEYSCNLDGYVGTTDGYLPGPAPFGFCGIIENDQYFSFVADESPVIIQITPSNCLWGKGIQASIYDSFDCNSFTPVANCASYGFEQTLTVTAPVVTIGKLYYIIVDGFEGDICDFTINVTSGILPDVEAIASDIQICAGNNVQLDGTQSSTGLNVFYQWTASNGGNIVSGANSLEPIINQIGDYTLMVVDTITCCMDEVMVSVTEETNMPTVFATASGALDCTNTEVVLDGMGSDTGNHTYTWSTSTGNIIGASDELVTTVNQSGTYVLRVNNLLTGCVATLEVEVVLDTISPIIDVMATDTLTCYASSIQIQTNASTNNLNYAWSGPDGFTSSDANPVVNNPGIYTLTATASNGCTQTAELAVIENTNAPILLTNVQDVLDCATDSVLIQGISSSLVSYEWTGPNNFTSFNNNPFVTEPGTYELTVTATNGCTESEVLTVLQDIEIPDVSLNEPGIINCTQNEIPLNSTSLTDNLSYEWIGPSDFTAATDNTIVSESGIYELIVTAQNGCTNTAQVEVEKDLNVPIADAGNDTVLNCAIDEVLVDGTNSSIGSNFAYEWLNSNAQVIALSPSFITDNADNYTLIVTDVNNGCSAISNTVVMEDLTPPVADITNTIETTLTCNSNQIEIDASASNTGDNFTYEWFNSAGTTIATATTIMVSDVDTYTFLITDQLNACTSEASISVQIDTISPSIELLDEAVLTCAEPEAILIPTNLTPSDVLDYEWYDPSGTSLATTNSINITTGGLYELVATNLTNGCTAATSIDVIANLEPPLANAGMPQVLTCADTTVDLNASASSLGDNYTYAWFNSVGEELATTIEIAVDVVDTYSLVVTDTNNACSATAQVAISQNIEAPYAEAGLTQTLSCGTQELTVGDLSSSTGANFTYEWFDSNANLLSTSLITMVNNADEYELVVTDQSNGCTDSSIVSIGADMNVPMVDAGSALPITCTTNEVQLSGNVTTNSGNYSMSWLDENNQEISNDLTTMVDAIGLYTLSVTDTQNGCEASDVILVQNDITPPVVALEVSNTLSCALPTSELNVSNISPESNLNYVWLDVFNQSIGSASNLEVTDAGLYVVLVTNADNGCTTMENIMVLDDFENPIADATITAELTCAKTEVAVNIGNSSTGSLMAYEWKNDQGEVISDATALAVEEPGTYELLVTNTENGCTDSADVIISQDIAKPKADAGDMDVLTCIVKEVILDGSNSTNTGNINYRWENSAGTMIGFEESTTVTTADIYTLFVKDLDNGCEDSDAVTIEEDTTLPTIELNTPDVITCYTTNTNLEVNETHNLPNYSYAWYDENGTNLDTADVINVNQSGTYRVVVTNEQNGCVQEKELTVAENLGTPQINAGQDAVLTCATPSVTLTGTNTNPTATYTYQWLDANDTMVSDALSFETAIPDTYTLIVTNSDNGCSSTDVVLLDENMTAPVSLIEADELVLTCALTALTLDGSASTGAAPITFQWLDAENTILSDQTSLSVSEMGTYELVITDLINGCTAIEAIDVAQNITPPEATIAPPAIINCKNTNIQLTGTPIAVGNYTYQWNSSNGNILAGENTLTPTVNQGGVYELTLVDLENQCSFTQTALVEADQENPLAEASATDILDCVTESITISGLGSSEGTIYAYEWAGGIIVSGATTLNPEVAAPGNYELLVTNTMNHCIAETQVEVLKNDDEPTGALVDLLDPLCYGDTDGQIFVDEVIGGTAPYLFSLNTEDFINQDAYFNLGEGNYTMTIQDAIGCEWDTVLTLIQPREVAVELGDDRLIELGETLTLEAFTSGDITAINWSSAAPIEDSETTTLEVTPLETTTYEILVANENGCLDTDEIILRVEKSRDVYIPNAFSPDQDGLNDTFLVFGGNSIQKVNKLSIFSRWGELLFTSEQVDPNMEEHGWDGTFKGERMQPGVYVYYAEIEFIDGVTELFKGDVTILY